LNGIRLSSTVNNENFEFNTFLSTPLDYENLPTTRLDQIIGNMKVKFLSSKGNGLLVWHSLTEQISRKPRTFYINSLHGLSSNNIEDIYLDKDENLWVASLKGLDKITFKEDLSFQIRNYNTNHGLPSNDIYEIQMNDSLIFLSTGSGLVQFKEPEFNPISKKPDIISAKLDHVAFDEYKEFNPSNNHLELEFITLNYKMPGQIPYRYRANKQEWVKTEQTNIQLLDLRPNDYLLEIQSQNEDGVWSESTTVDFHICFPWYQQWYFNLFLALIGLSIGYLFYKSRINRLKEQNQTSQEIRELEKAALQAQMNPHFIFNCLNSIQNFIMDNEQELAMEYLGNFANLIRQNLKASVDAKITLDEEVAMLENYLKLEQLRFSNKFDYSISVHENLDILDIKIAPLLIQPFVENAVLHGMSNIRSDGQINIHFSTVKDKLLVKISDNGGYRTQKQKKKHKSFGMSITQKRLAFINEIDNNNISTITNISAKGTEVDVLIKI